MDYGIADLIVDGVNLGNVEALFFRETRRPDDTVDGTIDGRWDHLKKAFDGNVVYLQPKGVPKILIETRSLPPIAERATMTVIFHLREPG